MGGGGVDVSRAQVSIAYVLDHFRAVYGQVSFRQPLHGGKRMGNGAPAFGFPSFSRFFPLVSSWPYLQTRLIH